MSIQRPRGTSDLLPGVVQNWQKLEDVARTTFSIYNFGEIRTPVFEHTEVFARGVGDTTDIVEKEMYTFSDRGDRSITLRPEGTAGVARAFVENKLYGNPGVTKLFYIGPMFRYERPKKGRERQFHQYGAEILGAEGPSVDAEAIALNLDILTRLGMSDLTVELNSVGCSTCRPPHKEKMVEALRPVADKLCKDCQSRYERNPLRIFDCKHDSCQQLLKDSGAPTIIESLCGDCREHFAGLEEALKAINTPYTINPHLVRGLDYYTRTAWEVKAAQLGTVAGGGRYNGLVSQFGGPETPGIGFAGGVERALIVLEEQGVELTSPQGLDVYVAVADASADISAAKFLGRLREHDVRADRDYQGKSLKAQFKAADREKARFVAVFGETEVQKGTVTLKDLESGEQNEFGLEEGVQEIMGRVKPRV